MAHEGIVEGENLLTDDSKCMVRHLYTRMSTVRIYRENVIIMITGSIMSAMWNLSYRGFQGAGRGRA